MAVKNITIDIKTAEKIAELYTNCEAADAAFQSCQSVQFRNHIQSVYKAPNVVAAFTELQQKIDATKE